jgi:hypothetical protein
MPLPKDNALRKALPLFTFLTEYFPDAILELVKVSVAGNMQHNPGEPMHWARGKSMDQLNTAQRHMWDYATTGPYNDEPPLPPEILAAIGGEPPMHLANAAWRLLAQIQLDCESRAAAYAASAQDSVELFPEAYQLTPDPLQPEERVVGMHPALAAPFGPGARAVQAVMEKAVSDGLVTRVDGGMPAALVNHSLVPGRLTLACGCHGYCKGGHPALVVPMGTGPRDPAGVPYAQLGPFSMVGTGPRDPALVVPMGTVEPLPQPIADAAALCTHGYIICRVCNHPKGAVWNDVPPVPVPFDPAD